MLDALLFHSIHRQHAKSTQQVPSSNAMKATSLAPGSDDFDTHSFGLSFECAFLFFSRMPLGRCLMTWVIAQPQFYDGLQQT
mmetsp:Transcript_82568/g.151183  ORF Transcript_82568/g.151183 Transcript_82568/m.151183 type:complete len:82 (+) Transcript_82568:1291-1536(+)